MIRGCASAIIRGASRLVPAGARSRWREEWLGELDAITGAGRRGAMRFAAGAVRDAWTARLDTQSESHAMQLSALVGDLKYAGRQLLRRPGHTAAVIACLVVGLVVSIGTFSVIESLLTGDQPGVHDRRGLARIYLSYDSGLGVENVGGQRVTADPLSLDDFALIRTLPAGSSLASIGAEGDLAVTLAGDHGPFAATGAFASAGFFRTLRTEPIAGRLFVDADDAPDAAPVAVVSDHFWRTHLDSRADAIGRPILIAGRSFTVIGVAPPRFHGVQPLDVGEDDSHGAQVWMPLAHAALWPRRPAADEPWLSTVGRLADGHTIAEAQRDLAAGAARIAAASPATRGHASVVVRPHGFGPANAPIQLLVIIALTMLVPLTVLGIGCANVANLQLARVAERSRELAVRLSLGATRRQLIRLLTLETLAGAAAAVALSLAMLSVMMRYAQPYFPMFLAIDWRVALFAVSLAVGVALGTGLMPAWLVLRKTAAGQLKQSAQSGGLGHSRLRATLIVTQVALSLGLLTMTALVTRTIRNMELSAPAALRQQVVASFVPAEIGMRPDEARRFADTLAARAAADARVTGVALSTQDSVRFGRPAQIDGGLVRPQFASLVGVSASWMDVMSVRLLAGRPMTDPDDPDAAIVSQRAAELLAPDGSALGLDVKVDGGQGRILSLRVVGIAADTPTRPTVERPEPVIYTPLPAAFDGSFTLRVRTASPDAVGADLLPVVRSVDPRVTWTSLRRGDMRFQDEAKEMGVLAWSVGVCGTIALLLSATGLYAVMAYLVSLRRREIGVRLAIGAAPSRIVVLVMRQAGRLVGIGAAVGVALSVPFAFLMRATFVARVNATDPLVFLPPLALLLAVGALAAAAPAFRAARVDPITTLRQD